MKKKLIIIIVITVIFGGTISYFYSQNNNIQKIFSDNKTDQELDKKAEEKLIAENKKKYQPKITEKTKTGGVEVAARSAIVVDQNTNEVIYAKNIEERMSPASIIKILTFVIALETFQENQLIEISSRAAEQIPNKISLKAGEKLKLTDLLYGLMMISANDAAYAIADFYKGGYDGFIEHSNKKAQLLGLQNTVMKNPAGFDDEGQVSTVFDISTITRYAMLEHPEIIKYAGKTTEHSVYATENNGSHWWFGHLSQMLREYPYMIAAKTGFTYEAGTTYVGIAEKNGRKLVLVMMGATGATANNDVKMLLDFGFAN